MGNFFVNYHLWNAVPSNITQVLPDVIETRAYVSFQKQSWVTVYDESSETQDEQKLHQLACQISTDLATAVFVFLVHDSDVLKYILYSHGQRLDEYNSFPDYFGISDLTRKEQLKGQPEVLLSYCQPGTSIEAIAHILQSRYTFAEDRLADLAQLLGIDEARVCLGFTDFSEQAELRNEFQLVSHQELALPEIQPEQFFWSAKTGDLIQLQTLLGAGCDPNLLDELGLSAITYAAARGHLPIVQALIAAHAQVNPANSTANTPLIAAAAAGHLEIVKVLLEAGADIHLRNQKGQTAIQLAAENGHEEIVQLLTRDTNQDSALVDARLIKAVTQGDLSQVQALITSGANVNTRNQQGHATALSLAASQGNLNVVEALIQAGAVVNSDSGVETNREETSMAALLRSFSQGLGAFIPNTQSTIPPLWCAAEGGHLPVVIRLLQAGARVNAGRYSAIIPAVSGGYVGVVQALLDAGATVDLDMGGGITPLMRAASMGYGEIVEILIARGADVKRRDHQGWDALEFAQQNDHAEVVRILQEARG
ncbi:ankyrin repeat-containing protein [Nostoc sp. PCC 7524]|uniref:ankyrin repeat domain-containing protein n=1 Tax=Nostoc sp. (strain ATCC 29411 / PCC 7524) TaxID=28072 RepID=UPI00029F248B|nr:ankyrin repeat domain-containing protein [Nostoc sp. PCC 7524]AFY51199.1 ankyrin repeat-containing protein [Nostoc sp. PCC 7524]